MVSGLIVHDSLAHDTLKKKEIIILSKDHIDMQ